jgi:hypothetical protein
MKNLKVVLFSIIALIAIVLTFTIHWYFIIIAIILMLLNQKELMNEKKSKK